MTLALAVGNGDGIYLATESFGLPNDVAWLLRSKVHDLQHQPVVSLLMAGASGTGMTLLGYTNRRLRSKMPHMK